MQARDTATFKASYAQGLSDERKVINFIKSLGYWVEASTKDDNMFNDIDCWVNGQPVSIKAEHTGLRYNNIYFELEQQLTETGEWVPSWWQTGKATWYFILQGQTLRCYLKKNLELYVTNIGWQKIRSLGWKKKNSQGGTYRFSDARCGFLVPTDVPHLIYTLPDTRLT
jgi:hypothetical protein